MRSGVSHHNISCEFKNYSFVRKDSFNNFVICTDGSAVYKSLTKYLVVFILDYLKYLYTSVIKTELKKLVIQHLELH